MRKWFPMLAVAFLCSGLTLVMAADQDEQTIQGDGQCAKCSLGETEQCQNAIVTEEDGEEVTYYMVMNDVAKQFHPQICQDIKTVRATGTVEERDGKKMLTPTKIEVVEE